MYKELIDSFSDVINVDDCFHTLSFELSKKKLLTSKSDLIFLLGNPGAGKTFLINYLMEEINDREFFYFPRGFDSKEELLRKLYISNIETNKEIFRNKNHLIIIDEAQLLDNSILEYIRTLSDTKCFNFLLSMHLNEGEKILSQSHFKSREIDVVELEAITKEDMMNFINKKLIIFHEQNLLTASDFNLLYRFTNGNFRYIKRIMKKSFELLKFAKENKIKKYKKINKAIITMAALDLGLVDE